jgi:hypothetical protein
MVHPYRAEELEDILALWEESGGWYRSTMPVSTRMVEVALRALAPPGGWRLSLGSPRRAGWVHPDSGEPTGFLYASQEPDVSYVVPFLRGAATGPETVVEMLSAAEAWFRARGVPSYLVDTPSEREALYGPMLRRGNVLWHRSIYRRPSGAPEGEVPPEVRPYSPGNARSVEALARERFPSGAPKPDPVPFLAVPRRSWSPLPSGPIGTRVWVLFRGERPLGVAGATRFDVGSAAELAPLLLSAEADRDSAADLVEAPLHWLSTLNVPQVRASMPSGLDREERALHDAGFERFADSDVVEVSLADAR